MFLEGMRHFTFMFKKIFNSFNNNNNVYKTQACFFSVICPELSIEPELNQFYWFYCSDSIEPILIHIF